MADRHITYKLKPFLQGSKVADSSDVEVDVSGFDGTGNLDSNDTDLQQVANALNSLSIGSGGMSMASVGGILIDVPKRIPLDTDISGVRTMHYRVYNYDRITHLSLFIDRGGLFSVVPVTHPTSNGDQSTTLTFPSVSTSSKTTINCYLVVNNNTVAGTYQIQVEDIPATDISVDRTSLSDVQGDDSQDIANELERLFGIVRGIQNDATSSGRPLNTFDSSVTITSSNLGDFINRNSLYVRSDNARVDFILPAESTIVGQYPAIFEIQNFGGTQRFDGGFSPTNTVVVRRPVDYSSTDPSTFLRRTSETGANLQFAELHRGDTAIITKQDADSPWVIIESSSDPRSSILPDGVFQLNSRGVAFPTNVNGDHFIGGLSLYTPTQGDAFIVTGSGITEESTFGRAINTGDVIVTKVDSPSLLLDENNDDWLIIRDAGGGDLTLRELRFLSTVSETDTFTDTRLEDRSDVNNVRVFLSPFILDHAPFINPSTDPDNPQSGETGEYIGGDELDGSDYDFRAGTDRIGDFDGVASATIANNALVYVDIDGGFDINENINDVSLVHIDRDGVEIDRYNLNSDFRTITLTGSTDTYYVFDDVGAADNFSSITFHSGQTLNVVIRTTNRTFNLGTSFDVLPSVKDSSIPIEKLSLNTQALIGADHSLSDQQEAKLNGLETAGFPTVWTAGELYVKANDHASSDLSNYVNVGQQNGIIPNYESTRTITFLVPTFVSVTGLQKSDNTATKLSVTPIGTILGRQAFTAVLPSITGANSVLDNAWQVDGMASNLRLTGANESFKVQFNNLDQSIVDRFTPHAQELPEVLQTLAHDLSVTQRTGTNWQEIPAPVNTPELTRQFAFGWDENRRNFGNDNYFEDLTGIEFIGYGSNNVFFYDDPNDPNNRSFPGAQSYVLNDNVRVRNEVLETTISDSFRKIIAFDYALESRLEETVNVPMLRIGGTSTTPLIGISGQEGLYLNIGNGDGGSRTRDIVTRLEILTGGDEYPFGSFGGFSTLGEAPFLAPNTNLEGTSYPVTIRVNIRLSNNGNDAGTFVHNYVITDIHTDQAETQFTATHMLNGNSRTFTWAIRYVHNNNHVTFGQQDVIFIRDVTAETNPALTDYVSMEYTRTVSWTAPSTYAEEPINAGEAHDDFGVFDPHRYNTEHVLERNRVILAIRPYDLTDVSSDPELAVHVIVDGEKEGDSSNGYLIRLHRSANEFDFTDMNFGNSQTAITHIQCYDYDSGHLFGENTLLDFYNASNRWLGRFRHPTETTDTFVFDGLAQFTGVIGGNDVQATMIADGTTSDGYRWKFVEV